MYPFTADINSSYKINSDVHVCAYTDVVDTLNKISSCELDAVLYIEQMTIYVTQLSY